jgi:hypothetical protein
MPFCEVTMELSAIHHIEPGNLNDLQADLFITTISHESRCTSIARMLEGLSCRKVALSRTESLKENAFRNNLEYFQDQGFEIIPVDPDVPDIGHIFKEFPGEEIRIIFDCTSMSQRWYYEFFRWFGESQDDFRSATLRFTYTMAAFLDEGPPPKVKEVREFLTSQSRPRKPKMALILGLGHEPNVSDTICRIVKPDLLYLFYADPPADKRFVELVFVNNHGLINASPIRNLIAYPIHNGQVIYQQLIDTILPLRDEYTIVLIPQGPKIFSVVSMLAQIRYPDTMISYPVFKRSQALDRQPCGEPVILDVHFEEGD